MVPPGLALSDVAPEELSRRERRKLEVRTRIFTAALDLFDRRGFHPTTVAEICERADVARKTFFNHFPSKRDVLSEVARHALADLLGHVERARREGRTTAGRVERFFEVLVERAEEVGPMRRELMTELVHLAHEEGTEPQQARALHEAFGAIVRDGLTAGDVRTDHAPEVLVEMILGTFYVQMFNWASFDAYPLREHALASARFLGEAITRPGLAAASTGAGR